ncbi:MAG: recombinase family protein [Eubacterium sp.]|nr:recombinase family protein [Eubacterium sp.]
MLKNRNIPFGYCVINGKYAINTAESEAIQRIFSEYINGKSLKVIAKEMTIPYNTGKAVWNKNMVCRILENKKYIGENGYPKIITEQDFEEAARIKAERNTYRKPIPQNNPQKIKTTALLYEPTEEIQRMTNEINGRLDSENPNKENIEALILDCAQLKYSTIKEVNVK